MHRFDFPGAQGAHLMAKTAALSVLLTGAVAFPAAAGTDWCDNDPVVTIPGHTAKIVTEFNSDYQPTLSDPLVYVILVPRSIAGATSVDTRGATLPTVASVVAVDDALWSGRYGKASFAVTLYVHATANFQTLTKVSGRNAGELTRPGKTNTLIEFTYSFNTDHATDDTTHD